MPSRLSYRSATVASALRRIEHKAAALLDHRSGPRELLVSWGAAPIERATLAVPQPWRENDGDEGVKEGAGPTGMVINGLEFPTATLVGQP